MVAVKIYSPCVSGFYKHYGNRLTRSTSCDLGITATMLFAKNTPKKIFFAVIMKVKHECTFLSSLNEKKARLDCHKKLLYFVSLCSTNMMQTEFFP